ncbi:DUF1761 domain-containing protein [Croceicoccus sp. F390]|uniref:DUF1761 domain-containing protein n=1 Tax=Croceicoccus esteveae TaxID=3075597 RepID=A0ABU2ZJQ5_9SPHN|nr:DUF1761 domain-containing protein [Croceicoccus sp. F390]MDT0576834.1 DUF1761 domain-containing protein [Croceicoccus sp. F390]
MDWPGVLFAALTVMIVAATWYRLFGRPVARYAGLAGAEIQRRPLVAVTGTFLLVLLSAAMLGHMFARIDPERWWLFPMMSGGIAVAFIIPALWTNYLHQRRPRAIAMVDAGFWLVAYLSMGLVFWSRS